MRKVRQDLYIGSMEDATSFLSGERRGVTHMLSLEKVRVRPNCKAKKQAEKLSKLQQVLLDLRPRDPVFDDVAAELAAKCPSLGQQVDIVVKTVPLKDVDDEDLLGPLDSCLDFIDEGREQGIVLVHCGAGISRSGAVVTAYLMGKEMLTLDDALESLRKSAPQVAPNDGFTEQLRDLGKRLKKPEPCQERASKLQKISKFEKFETKGELN